MSAATYPPPPPTLGEIRDLWIVNQCLCGNHVNGCMAERWFDSALAAHDREVAAKAWDEARAWSAGGSLAGRDRDASEKGEDRG